MHRKVKSTFNPSRESVSASRSFRPVLAAACALSLGLFFSSCEDTTAAPAGTSPGLATVAGATTEAKPTARRLVQRAAERWDLICRAGDQSKLWIDVYDYEAPAARDAVPLSRFLGNKEDFHYDNPSAPVPLLIEDDTAYVSVNVIWEAGKHSKIGAQSGVVGADPNRIEFLDMVETWKFVEGDWYFLGPAVRRVDFLEENPDIVRRAQKANEAAQAEKAAATEESSEEE